MAPRQLLPDPRSRLRSQPKSTSTSKFRKPSLGLMSTQGKRSNVTSACEACRSKKSRCDGNQPCATCISLQRECVFLRRDRRRQHERGEPLRALQAEVENLQVTLEVLRFGSDDEALQALKELRSEALDDSSQVTSDATTQEASQSSPNTSRNKSYKRSAKRQWDDQELSLQDPLDPPSTFTVSHLPPRSIIKTGAQLFFDIVSGLLYIVDESYYDEICQRMYSESGSAISDIAEVCAIAAIGLQFDPDAVTTDLRDALFRTGVLYTNDLIDEDSIRALRCLACACMYGMLEKRRSIRALIHLGLQVARWSFDPYEDLDEEHMELKKLFKTMVFLECWLSTTLGYAPDLHVDELRLIQGLSIPPGSDLNEISRAKIGELALLRVRILKHVCSAGPLSGTTIEQLTTDMETWYQSLPASMTLTALFQQKADTHAVKPQGVLILAHAKYLGAVILLHRPILATTASMILNRDQTASGVALEQAQRPHYLCVEAARSSARIFVLLDFTAESSNLYTKCWLFVFEVFTVATVLLYDVALKISMDLFRDTILLEDFERTKACLTILEHSTVTDPVAQQRESILSSVYQNLKALHTSLVYGSARASNVTQSSMQSSTVLSNTLQDAMDPHFHDVTVQAINALVAILNDPFGHGQDVGFNIFTQEPNIAALE